MAEFVGTPEIVRENISAPTLFQLQIEATVWYTIGSNILISMKEAMPKRARDKYPSYMNDLASTNAIIGKQEKRSDPDGKYRSKWQIHSSDLANYAWTFDRLF